MVWSNLLSGLSQAIVAVLLLSHHASIPALAVFAAVNGASSAFFFPASYGIVPQTVPPPLLQQANAMLRLGQTATSTRGAAIGGHRRRGARAPGWAIAADAIKLRPRRSGARGDARPRRRARARRRRCSTICASAGTTSGADGGCGRSSSSSGSSTRSTQGRCSCSGPRWRSGISAARPPGPAVLVAIEAGVIASGIVLLRWKPRRILRTATFGAFGLALPLVALARPAPLVLVIAAAFASGYMTEIFGVLWDTTTSRRSRTTSSRGSRPTTRSARGPLMPLGFAVAGPVGAAVGTRATFIGAAVIVVVATALVFLCRDVRTLERRREPLKTRAGCCRPTSGRVRSTTISSMFTFAGRVSANMIESATSSGLQRPAHRDVRVDRARLVLVAAEAHAREVGLDEPRGDVRDPHRLPLKVVPQRARVPVHRELRRDVRRPVRIRPDPATEPRLTMWPAPESTRCCTHSRGDPHQPEDVGDDHFALVLVLRLPHGVAAASKARVVDQDVEAAQLV